MFDAFFDPTLPWNIRKHIDYIYTDMDDLFTSEEFTAIDGVCFPLEQLAVNDYLLWHMNFLQFMSSYS
jgi:hypothetical protein